MQETSELSPTPNQSRPGRTFELWILILMMAIMAVAGFSRAGLAMRDAALLNEIGIQPGPVYLMATGILSGMFFLTSTLALLLRQCWASDFTRVGVVVYALWSWIDRLALTHASDAQANFPFSLAATLILLAYVFAVLALNRQKRFFKS